MTQESQRFTPNTVDEQIENISNLPPTNVENSNDPSGEYIVRRLHYLYQSEQRDMALARGWERIVQASNSMSMQDTVYLGQDSRNETSQHTTNRDTPIVTPLPDNQPKPNQPLKSRRRIITLVQTLAAVVIVGVVLASFLAFVVYRTVTSGAKDLHPQPSAVHSIVAAVTLNGTVYAFQPGSKQILWSFSQARQEKSSGVTSALVILGRTVYTVVNGQMYALNANDGTLLWRQRLTLPNSVQNDFHKMISDHDVLYIGGTDYVGESLSHSQSSGNIYAIRASDGKILWHYQDATPDLMITAHNRNVYVEAGVTLLDLNGDTGKIRWKKAAIVSRAMVAEDTTVYIDAQFTVNKVPGEKNGVADAIVALSTQDGHMLWSIPVINHLGGQSRTFAFDQGMIILSFLSDYPYNYNFCAYKASNGASVWCSPKTADPLGMGVSSYMVMNHTIYAAVSQKTDYFIEARNVADGKLLWSKPFLVRSITGVNEVVYALGAYGVSAFDSKTGHELWHFSARDQSVLTVSFAVGSW